MTPSAAASPKALPPASSRPCTVSTCDSGRMSSVSRQPGANPGTAMPGVKPCGQRMAVQPVWFRSSVAWPASRPSMAVRVVLLMGTPVAEVGSCARATIRLLPGEGAWDKSFMFTRKRKASLVGGCGPQSGPYREGEDDRPCAGRSPGNGQEWGRSRRNGTDIYQKKPKMFLGVSRCQRTTEPRANVTFGAGLLVFRQMPRIRPACPGSTGAGAGPGSVRGGRT